LRLAIQLADVIAGMTPRPHSPENEIESSKTERERPI